MPSSTWFNMGIRECGVCGFQMRIIYPFHSDIEHDELMIKWDTYGPFLVNNEYMDNFVESVGWVIDKEHNKYICCKCQKEKNNASRD